MSLYVYIPFTFTLLGSPLEPFKKSSLCQGGEFKGPQKHTAYPFLKIPTKLLCSSPKANMTLQLPNTPEAQSLSAFHPDEPHSSTKTVETVVRSESFLSLKVSPLLPWSQHNAINMITVKVPDVLYCAALAKCLRFLGSLWNMRVGQGQILTA